MSPATTQSQGFTLPLSEEERTQLLTFLEQTLRDKQVEVRRTEALGYRKYVQHQEALLEGLLDKLRRSSSTTLGPVANTPERGEQAQPTGLPRDRTGDHPVERQPAVEWGERIETGKTIARGGKTTGSVPGATEQKP